MGQVILGVEYFGEWVEEKSRWKWIGKSKEVIPIAVSTEVSFDELIDEIIRRGNLSCSRSDIVVKYVLSRVPEHYKVPPVILKSDESVKLYMIDVADNGSRPILRVSFVEKQLEVGSNEGDNEEVGEDLPGSNLNYEAIDLLVETSRVDGELGGEEETVEEVGDGGQNENVEEEDPVHVPTDVEIPLNTNYAEGIDCEEENTMVVYTGLEGAIGGSSESAHVFTDGSELHVGYLFDNKEEVVRKLKLVAVRGNFEFITKKSNSLAVTVACCDRKCKWRVYCRRLAESKKFILSTYTREHTCGLGHISGEHRQASADVIGQFVKSRFVEGKCPSPKDIQRLVRTELGCVVSYWKCWKGRQYAQDFVGGTPFKKTTKERKRVERIPSAFEIPRKMNKCSICKQLGHKRSSCQKQSHADSEN
ncbi:hypothetical protein Pint_24243 [Pistacia integerrima]|uniref:Uncharacterized protein n=1 Tax=Pistacia integerrima TaxID=434235 RepID=A0ACC0YCP8_9ROSI|nr:hypothetical protein Pint_24243 [Pistacia integerrima]